MSTIKETIIRNSSRAGLYLRKHSPEILTGVGIIGGVTAAVMGAKATLKVEGVIDEINEKREMTILARDKKPEEYSKEDQRRDLAIIYTRGAIQLAKLYGPAISLGVGSIICIVSAHGIMRRRNAAIAVAYNTLEKSFAQYRERVAEELGEEKAHELRYGIVDTEILDEETGKKEIKKTLDPNGYSQYAKIFDEYNTNWQKNPEYNLLFLRQQQQYLNDRLLSRGHVFLNEVYDALGFPHTQAGALTGWVLNGEGDGFIDFGIYSVEHDKAREFVNGWERSIVLDFNVDGVIYNLI